LRSTIGFADCSLLPRDVVDNEYLQMLVYLGGLTSVSYLVDNGCSRFLQLILVARSVAYAVSAVVICLRRLSGLSADTPPICVCSSFWLLFDDRFPL
jgi:hypothetical protein